MRAEMKAEKAEIEAAKSEPPPKFEKFLGCNPFPIRVAKFVGSVDLPGKSGSDSITSNLSAVGVNKWRLEYFAAPMDMLKVTLVSGPKPASVYIPREFVARLEPFE